MIPLFKDFVETRYRRGTLNIEPEMGRDKAKQLILTKLEEIREKIHRVSKENQAWNGDPNSQYQELADICKAGGLPLDRPDTMGEHLGRIFRNELFWFADKFKSSESSSS